MELKEFIKETLVQIAEGVKLAQDDYAKLGGKVNPDGMYEYSQDITHGNPGKYQTDRKTPLSRVDFEISLSDEAGESGKSGIGVLLGALTLGSVGEDNNKTTSLTKVRFSVPVKLP